VRRERVERETERERERRREKCERRMTEKERGGVR